MKPPVGMFTAEEEKIIAAWEKWRFRVGDRHGSRVAYNAGCRCDCCRESCRLEMRDRRAGLFEVTR